MRVMFCVFPAPAHFLPLVSYAWALQAAGHEVRIAAPSGQDTGITSVDFDRVVTATGLIPAVCGEPEPLAVHDRGHPGWLDLLPTEAETERFSEVLDLDAAGLHVWEMFHCFQVLAARDYHPPKPRQDVLALVDFAVEWRPDLVLWDPWLPGGAVAARVSGAAHARVLNAPDYSGFVLDRIARRRAEGVDVPEDPLTATVRPLAEHFGLTLDEELLLGQWTVDPFPDGLRLPSRVPSVSVRNVPFNGAAPAPDWLHTPSDRPRIGLSLGVSVRKFMKGDWGRTAKLLDAVADLDVDVIATLDKNQLADRPAGVPSNVRTVDYIPLNQLLPTCAALIHHGSTGTFASATAFGVPQLICDTDEPVRCYGKPTEDGIEWRFDCQKQLTATETAEVVTRHGAGFRIDHQKQSAEEIRDRVRRVLEEPSHAEGAAALRRGWLATPGPTEIVGVLERLTAENRA